VTAPHDAVDAAYSSRNVRRVLSLWAGVVLSPLIFLVALEVAYALVPPACFAGGRLNAALHAVQLASIVACIALGAHSWSHVRATGSPPDDGGTVRSRSRFLAWSGVVASAFAVLLLVAQWVPTFVLGPCAGVGPRVG
jgi:hypothetical protein